MKKITLLIILIVIHIYSDICADTITVDIKGTGQYTTIQEGIDNSIDGDIVLVYPGRYIENVNFNGKSITLASLELTTRNEAYIDSTIIDGNRAGSCVKVLNNEDAVIRGFTITNGKGTEWPNTDSRGGGILTSNWYADNTELDVINCIIKGNLAGEGGGGIFVSGVPHNLYTLTLSGVTIKENKSRTGGGITSTFSHINFEPNNLCNIYNNHAGLGNDIYVVDSCNINVVVDTFTVQEPEGFYAEYIRAYDHGSFIFDIQNAWMEEINHDLYVAPYGDNSNSGLSSDYPLKTIGIATYRIANDSLNPKAVHVAEGVYSKSLNNQIFPISMKRNTSLIGENIDTKIIHDDTLFNTTIYAINQKDNIEISNFTFESNCNIRNIIMNERSKSQNFNNIIFKNITCNSSIISAYLADSVSYKNLLFNNIESSWNGCISQQRYNCTIDNCIFTNNYAHGYPSYTNLYLIIQNYTKINNSIFTNNSNNNSEIHLIAIGYWDFCDPFYYINNCLFNENITPSICIFGCCTTTGDGYISISNCTFANNSATVATLAMVGTIDFSNNIMWDNTPYEIYLWDLSNYGIISTLNLQYNNIKNGEAGVCNVNNANIVNWLDGNINADPQFTYTGDFPYYLSSTSPCIDAGTPDTTGLHLPWLDVAGNPRVYGGRIDMGAYEWQGYSVDPDTNVVSNLYFFKNTPNPFRDQTTISFTSLDYDRVREYTLLIYNSRGQLVRKFYGPNEHFWAINEIVWNGKDMDGNITSPGVYFYAIEYEDTVVVRKMVKLR